jgi:SPP1 gp7 family putative phage head morphogenesis protein
VRVKRLTKAIELSAREELLRRVDEVKIAGINKELVLNAPVDQVVNYINGLKENWSKMYEKVSDQFARKWTGAVSTRQKSSLEESLKRALNTDFAVILDTGRVYEAEVAAAVEASSLIKSIPQQYAEEIQKAVLRNYHGIPFPEGRDLAEEIEHRFGVTRERAIIIARDQTAKINSAVTRARCLDIGAKFYVWRTMEDLRVVGNPIGLYPRGNKLHGNHYARHGQEFNWESPPSDGHPGHAINCRCVAVPIIETGKLKLA